MTTQAYFVGRKAGSMQSPYNGSQEVYGSQRLDGLKLAKPTYEHCTFANISFKESELEGGQFLNCAFIACYFRKSDIRNCSFSSCRFINCEFPGASFGGCDFRYTRFVGCYVSFAEIEHNLPQEPNLREELARNLSREAATLGDSRNARTYRLCEVQARESHYRAAVMAQSKWYRDHYDAFARIDVALRLIVSLINRMLFGYGERLWVLVRNYAIATFVLFPLLFYWTPDALSAPPARAADFGAQVSFWTALEFSVDNAVAGALGSTIHAVGWTARLFAATETILTAIWASLVAAYLFRWSLHR